MLTLSVVMLVGPIENTFWHYPNFNNVVFIDLKKSEGRTNPLCSGKEIPKSFDHWSTTKVEFWRMFGKGFQSLDHKVDITEGASVGWVQWKLCT